MMPARWWEGLWGVCWMGRGGINGANSSRGRKGENGRRNKQILLDVLVLCSRAQKTLPLSNRFQ